MPCRLVTLTKPELSGYNGGFYMPKTYNLYQIDSFTNHLFKGNPAGVITNADGLSDKEMQSIARELNNSETAFIMDGDSSTHDIYIRYFTPTHEVPICGHATIAAHYAMAYETGLSTSKRVMQKSGVGILPVDVKPVDETFSITMTQGNIEYGDKILGEYKEQLLQYIGIRDEDLMRGVPIQIVSTGHSKVMIPLESVDILNGLQPNLEGLSELSRVIGCNGYYPFIFSDCDDILVEGRMFAPAIGISEDPVTGNANGPLGAYLIYHKLVTPNNNDSFNFNALQGSVMGRPGVINVNVLLTQGMPTQVKISGSCKIVFKTHLTI